jgi:hypothetical protein
MKNHSPLSGSWKSVRFTLAFALLFAVSTFGFYACTQKEVPSPTTNLTKTNSPVRVNKSATILGTNVHDFIRSFYNGASYTIGRQIETTNNGTTYLVSEVVVSSARGYVVTNQAGNTPLYFADVDRTNFILTSVDIANNETVTAQNINQLREYALTDEFDFIKVVGDANDNGGYEIEKFWGWGPPEEVLIPCTYAGMDEDGLPVMATKVRRSYYVLGIKVRTTNFIEEC